jgi:hypothetical protein
MNRIFLAFVVVVAVGGGAAVAMAATNTTFFVDGDELLRYCRSTRELQRGLCNGIIVGVSDGATSSAPDAGTGFCQPVKTTRGMLQTLVVKWLEAHPNDRSRPAAELITRAFIEVFPCQAAR